MSRFIIVFEYHHTPTGWWGEPRALLNASVAAPTLVELRRLAKEQIEFALGVQARPAFLLRRPTVPVDGTPYATEGFRCE